MITEERLFFAHPSASGQKAISTATVRVLPGVSPGDQTAPSYTARHSTLLQGSTLLQHPATQQVLSTTFHTMNTFHQRKNYNINFITFAGFLNATIVYNDNGLCIYLLLSHSVTILSSAPRHYQDHNPPLM